MCGKLMRLAVALANHRVPAAKDIPHDDLPAYYYQMLLDLCVIEDNGSPSAKWAIEMLAAMIDEMEI